MSFPDFLAYLNTIEKFLLVVGVLLVVLAILSPTRFFGVQVAWSPLKSASVLLLGVFLFGLSFPQVRLYALPPAIAPDHLKALSNNLSEGRQLCYAASTNTSDPASSCAGRASQSLPYLDQSLKSVAAMQAVLAPSSN